MLTLATSACGNACSRERTLQVFACGAGATDTAVGSPDSGAVEVYAVVDLPGTPATHGLSGTAFDETTRTLYALEDKRPRFLSLEASPDYKSWALGPQVTLSGYRGAWDGEGVARILDGGFYVVTNERKPSLARFDASGAFVEKVDVPDHYANQVPNKGLESLALSPDSRFLFTANEGALRPDGRSATKSHGTLVRILRRELATSHDDEFAYRTEALGGSGSSGDMGVSELAAVSGDQLLVLERGYQASYGNTVRIFRTDLANTKSVLGAPLDDSSQVLTKSLLVDVATLHCQGVTHSGKQPNPILENYEAMTLGPRLGDGRRLLFLTSDDNGRNDQVARILVLAVRGL